MTVPGRTFEEFLCFPLLKAGLEGLLDRATPPENKMRYV
jgi:hypothetical protein